MKKFLLASLAVASVSLVAPFANASVVSILDNSPDESVHLFIDQPNNITSLPTPPPGGGTEIDITTPTSSNGISHIVYHPAVESLAFVFANHVNWGADVYYYRYFTEPGVAGIYSDLFVLQGLNGSTPDFVTFISSDALTGNIAVDGPAALGAAVPSNLGTVPELPQWQLAFDTGADQYYITSVPEPASMALLGAGLLGLGFARRRRG